LLFQSADDCHNTFNETPARLTLSAKAAIAPEYARTDFLFGEIVGRFYTFNIDKCPQSRFSFENISASASRRSVHADCALPQQRAYLSSYWLHLILKLCSGQTTLLDEMPLGKYLMSGVQERLAPATLHTPPPHGHF